MDSRRTTAGKNSKRTTASLLVAFAMTALASFGATTYTWVGKDDGTIASWEDPNNWDKGDYPKNDTMIAKFGSGSYNVTIKSDITINKFTFTSGGTVNLSPETEDVHPNITATASISVKGTVTFNGVSLHCKKACQIITANSKMVLQDRSVLVMDNDFDIVRSTAQLEIDDSTVIISGEASFGNSTTCGGHVVFKGNNPVWRQTGKYITANNSASMTTKFNIDFVVPSGGFAEAPIQCAAGSIFGDKMDKVPDGYFSFNVLSTSPALTSGGLTDCPLLLTPSGIASIARITLPSGDGIAARFTDGSSDGTTTETSEAKALFVSLGSGEKVQPDSDHGSMLEDVTSSATVDRHVITTTCWLAGYATGANPSSLEIWSGETDDEDAMTKVYAVTPSVAGLVTLVYTAPEDIGEKKLYLQIRLIDTDGECGRSNVFTADTVDKTVYTWKDKDGVWSGNWSDPDHWSSDYASAKGYPYSANSTAVFPSGHSIAVTIDQDHVVGSMTFSGASAGGTDLTFKRSGESTLTVADDFTLNRAAAFDDVWIAFGGNMYLDTAAAATTVFSGKNPKLRFAAGKSLCAKSGLVYTFDFLMPIDGFTDAPIASEGATAEFPLYEGESRLKFEIDVDSPCFAKAATFDSPLVAWDAGVKTDGRITFGELDGESYFTYADTAAEPFDWTDVKTFSGTAKASGIHIVSDTLTDKLTVATDYETVTVTPAAGVHSQIGVAKDGKIAFSSPSTTLLEGVRYVCTGYTLREISVDEHGAATNVTEGTTAAFDYTLDMKEVRLDWHYRIDYKVTHTAVNDASGSVTILSGDGFITDENKVTLRAETSDSTKEFQYWYGDVAFSNRYDREITLSGMQPISVYAFFGNVKANAATIKAESGETTKTNEWFAAATWTGRVIPGTNDTAELHRIVATPDFSAVGKLFVADATFVLKPSSKVECASLDLDGSLYAEGKSWLFAGTFDPDFDCQVGVKGGRLAVCENLTGPQILEIVGSEPPAASEVDISTLSEKLGSRFSAGDGSGLYIVNVIGKKIVKVAAVPENLGHPQPYYGVNAEPEGGTITLTGPEEIFTSADNRSKRVCGGYVITNYFGETLATGKERTGEYTVVTNCVVTWDMTTLLHKFESEATVGGSIETNAISSGSSEWQKDGSTVTLIAKPAAGFVFVGWYGEVPSGMESAATLSMTLSGGCSVKALFVSDVAGAVAWTGAGDGENWDDAANWSGGAIPGAKNDVTIPAGATVKVGFPLPITLKSLTVEEDGEIAGTASLRIHAKELVNCFGTIAADGDLFVSGYYIVTGADTHFLSYADILLGLYLNDKDIAALAASGTCPRLDKGKISAADLTKGLPSGWQGTVVPGAGGSATLLTAPGPGSLVILH